MLRSVRLAVQQLAQSILRTLGSIGTATDIVLVFLKRNTRNRLERLSLWRSGLQKEQPRENEESHLLGVRNQRDLFTSQSNENWEMTELGGEEEDYTEDEIEWFEKGLRD